MMKKIVLKILAILFSKPLTDPTKRDLELIEQLKKTFENIPINSTKDLTPSGLSWTNNMNRLRELVLNDNPRDFLRWDVILYTMFVAYNRYIPTELRYLKQNSDWNNCWSDAIKESNVGHPIYYIFYPSSSANLIHHAYHIAQFKEKTNVKLENIDFIFEFGGGYGSMCRLLFNVKFKGKYVIFDLPQFSALQKFYLKSLNLPIHDKIEDFKMSSTGIVCISDLNELKELVINDTVSKQNSLFLGTWSISETPISVRNSIIPLLSDFKLFLIAYQHQFGEVNNIDYFTNFRNSKNNIKWQNWQIDHLPKNSYLVGKSDNN